MVEAQGGICPTCPIDGTPKMKNRWYDCYKPSNTVKTEDKMENKIKAWGVEQAVWGAVNHEFYWFASKEERDKYVVDHDHLDKLRCRMIEKENVFQTYEDWKKWNREAW